MDFMETSENEVLKIANPIMDNLMEASTNIDYEAHIRDYYKPIPELFTKEKFEKDCAEYQVRDGVFTTREYLGLTRNSDFINIYWKQKYSKAVGEHLAILTLVMQNNKLVALRAFVDQWQPKS
ncbi:hypothetical protein ACVBE9_11745 [Eionea flava]